MSKFCSAPIQRSSYTSFILRCDIFFPCDLIFPTIPIFVDDDDVIGTDDDGCDDDGEDDGGDDYGDEGDDYDDDDIGQCTLLCYCCSNKHHLIPPGLCKYSNILGNHPKQQFKNIHIFFQESTYCIILQSSLDLLDLELLD